MSPIIFLTKEIHIKCTMQITSVLGKRNEHKEFHYPFLLSLNSLFFHFHFPEKKKKGKVCNENFANLRQKFIPYNNDCKACWNILQQSLIIHNLSDLWYYYIGSFTLLLIQSFQFFFFF